MGLKVIITPGKKDIIDNKISRLEDRIAEAKKAGKSTAAMEKELKALDAKKQSMMDTIAEDQGAEAKEMYKSKKAPMPKPRPQRKAMGGAVKKPAMAYGGTANMKKHMYAAGGQVTDNMKGLKALAKKRPDVVRKMGYNV
tara:strand:+ start:54 stop:473 length:420 start_codon:yes stop_codon:yes gene_type:complete